MNHTHIPAAYTGSILRPDHVLVDEGLTAFVEKNTIPLVVLHLVCLHFATTVLRHPDSVAAAIHDFIAMYLRIGAIATNNKPAMTVVAENVGGNMPTCPIFNDTSLIKQNGTEGQIVS